MASAPAEKDRERERKRRRPRRVWHGFAKTANGRRLLRNLIGVEFSSKEIAVCIMKIFLSLFVSCVFVPRDWQRDDKANSSNFKFHDELLDELSDDCSNS